MYRVLRDYRSDRMSLRAGQVIDLPDELSAWIERDCPGTLQRVTEAPPRDRMVRRSNRRSAT